MTALITKVLIGRWVALLGVTVVTGLWGSKKRCGLEFLNNNVRIGAPENGRASTLNGDG